MWPSLAGRVVDRRGDPVAGARVWFERAGPAGDARTTAALTTDAEGRFARGPLARAARTVLVQAPGIAHGTRFDLAALGAPSDVRLVTPVKTSVKIAATRATLAADSVAFLDRYGVKVAVTITRGDSAHGASDVALVDGETEVITVPDLAVQLVLSRHGNEVTRVPVDLAPGRLIELRP
jgi:hypothetical protein